MTSGYLKFLSFYNQPYCFRKVQWSVNQWRPGGDLVVVAQVSEDGKVDEPEVKISGLYTLAIGTKTIINGYKYGKNWESQNPYMIVNFLLEHVHPQLPAILGFTKVLTHSQMTRIVWLVCGLVHLKHAAHHVTTSTTLCDSS